MLGHGLHAVADAQHRHALLERRLRGPRGLGGGDGFRAAGEDDALGVELGDVFGGGVEGADFAVDADFAYAAGDQLGVLGAEVEDQDALGVNVLHGFFRSGPGLGRCFKCKGRRVSRPVQVWCVAGWLSPPFRGQGPLPQRSRFRRLVILTSDFIATSGNDQLKKTYPTG